MRIPSKIKSPPTLLFLILSFSCLSTSFSRILSVKKLKIIVLHSLRTYTKNLKQKAKLKMKINNILLDGLCLGFLW